MALTGNKGEWSEIYTLFKLLGDGKVHAGDANMNKLELYYPILNIIREESKRYEYKPNFEQHIVVIDEDGNEYARISMDRFVEESTKLLSEIKTGKKSAFEIPEAEAFMGELGSASTLLNAGATTNITYTVCGKNLSDEEIAEINSIDSHLERMAEIAQKGCSLSYKEIDSAVFMNNLQFLDICMPQFIADCLLVDSVGDDSSLTHCVSEVAKKNPFGYNGKNVAEFYEHKMKVLLLSAALGMTPGKEWTGRYDANGGYLVVRKDGEIVCYHFYNQNDVEDYLYNNTRFERASRGRYNFGSLYRGDDGGVYIKLNLQIRFKK